MDNLKRNKEKGLYISTITLAELEFGNENSLYKEKNKVALIEFLSIMTIKPFDENAAREFGMIKKYLKDRNNVIGPYDMLIGAHAKSLNMTIVTNNVKEFKRIPDLKIENWV